MTGRSSSRLPAVPSTTTPAASSSTKLPVCLDQDVLPGNAVGQMLTEPLSHFSVMACETKRYPIFATAVLGSRVVEVVHVENGLPVLSETDHTVGLTLRAWHRPDRRRIIAPGFVPDLQARLLDLEPHDRADKPHRILPSGHL